MFGNRKLYMATRAEYQCHHIIYVREGTTLLLAGLFPLEFSETSISGTVLSGRKPISGRFCTF
jgi:hypothetical protein